MNEWLLHVHVHHTYLFITIKTYSILYVVQQKTLMNENVDEATQDVITYFTQYDLQGIKDPTFTQNYMAHGY